MWSRTWLPSDPAGLNVSVAGSQTSAEERRPQGSLHATDDEDAAIEQERRGMMGTWLRRASPPVSKAFVAGSQTSAETRKPVSTPPHR